MLCPRCKVENDHKTFCNLCNLDISIINKYNNISNILYNKSLNMIYIDNITDAINNLNKSLFFNKHNTNARNLLGVLYFHIFKIDKAFEHWSISLKLCPIENRATYYIDNFFKSIKNLEKLNTCIESYNQTLSYLNQKSEDIAIIQLKKIVDSFPNFIDALNLLSLCYMIQNDFEKASSIVSKVIDIDCNNQIAHTYKNVIRAKFVPKNMLTISKNNINKNISTKKNYFNAVEKDKKSIFNNFGFYSYIYLLMGAFIGTALVMILIVPSTISSSKKVIDSLRSELAKLQEEKIDLEQNNAHIIEVFENTKNTLEIRNKELEEKVTIHDITQKLDNISSLLISGKYEDAVNILTSMSDYTLPSDLSEKYDQYVLQSYPRMANIVYNRALAKFRSKNYIEAKVFFNETLKFADRSSSQYGDSLFYLGEISFLDNEPEVAKNYYQEVVTNHKSAKNYWTAKNKLTKL